MYFLMICPHHQGPQIAALRDARMKKTEIRITEKKTKKIGLVVNALSPKIGGRLKSTALGGVKPSPSDNRVTRTYPNLPSRINQTGVNVLRAKPYGEMAVCAKSLLPAESQPDQIYR